MKLHKKKDKPLDLSSLVGDCIEISNPFLKDFEVVILFVMWVESPSPKASLIKGRFGGIVGMSRRGRPPIRKKRRNKSFLLFE